METSSHTYANGGQPPAAPAHANPVRGRLNAWFLHASDDLFDELFGRRKRDLLVDLPERVVEIGPGAGANFRYYPPGTEVVAVEPNRYMHERLEARAAAHRLRLELVPRGAEATGLADERAALVVSTLVLCTVAEPAQVLAEVRRLLVPGGRFVFVEHVAAPRGTWAYRIQRALERPWRWAFEGCHTTRDTLADIEAAGFSRVDAERYTLESLALPVNPQIAGVAYK